MPEPIYQIKMVGLKLMLMLLRKKPVNSKQHTRPVVNLG
ncbi:hypothetical protein SAMN05216325_10365 [Nitrosomonas marina]|uniref:Uncharacterized protein n=1 Tax=Nitrosomonas marina TaxID=917 RepID=A0A1H8BU44_9PROT|nr:hypothetical protein SAMN05216325_10365 [Nitrosomonas marina]